MSKAPLYCGSNLPETVGDGHRGLWYNRFFNGYSEAWALNEKSKLDWITTVTKGTAGHAKDIEQASLRLLALCEALQGQRRVFGCDWHFVTGLGNPHPVENGFLWHPTLGTPYIPGAAVKGLLRSWLECWVSFAEDERKQKLHLWFGSEDKDPLRCETEDQAGALVFFDALPVEPVTLKADVMTPHLGQWYEQGNNINEQNQADALPADWHNPVPVHFLVADKPSFCFLIAPRRAEFQQEAVAAMADLAEALQWLGAGAKTAVGYGLMQDQPAKAVKLQQLVAAGAAQKKGVLEAEERRLKRQQELAQLPPLERAITERFEGRTDQNQNLIAFTLHQLRDGLWQGQEKEIAQFLQTKMREAKEWRPQSQKKNPEKDREHQKTLQVMKWLEP